MNYPSEEKSVIQSVDTSVNSYHERSSNDLLDLEPNQNDNNVELNIAGASPIHSTLVSSSIEDSSQLRSEVSQASSLSQTAQRSSQNTDQRATQHDKDTMSTPEYQKTNFVNPELSDDHEQEDDDIFWLDDDTQQSQALLGDHNNIRSTLLSSSLANFWSSVMAFFQYKEQSMSSLEERWRQEIEQDSALNELLKQTDERQAQQQEPNCWESVKQCFSLQRGS